jgi:hypothetical protein
MRSFILALLACGGVLATGSVVNAQQPLPPGATPTVMPAPANSETEYQEPSVETVLGPLTIKCPPSGVAHYFLGQKLIGEGAECSSDIGPTLTASRNFKDGRQIMLVEQIGSTGHAGDIILVDRNRRVGVVHVDYLVEFSKLTSPDQVVYASQGVVDLYGPVCVQSHGIAIDWVGLKGRAAKTLSSSGSC